jgi:hypothetical protein
MSVCQGIVGFSVLMGDITSLSRERDSQTRLDDVDWRFNSIVGQPD